MENMTTDIQSETEIFDPVCGMRVDPQQSEHHCVVDGTTYWFCCRGCLNRFLTDSEKYLDPDFDAASESVAVSPGTQFTCPMHPEIIQIGPGQCPSCGMALQPMDPLQSADEPNHELIDFTRRLRIGLVFGLPVLGLAMLPHLGIPLHQVIDENVSNVLQLILSTPIFLWCGWPFLQRGWSSIRNRALNMFSLIALGTSTAYVFSVMLVLFPDWFERVFSNTAMQLGVYFEVSSTIIVLVLVGQIMELKGRDRTGQAIRSLMELSPDTGMRLTTSGKLEEVALDSIGIGDRLRVRPGDHIPLDGHVIEGQSDVNEALLTGEALTIQKTVGDPVRAGTLNGSGAFDMQVDSAAADTTLAQIIRMVSKAQLSRAPIQRTADRAAAWFVPIVMIVAVVALLSWLALDPVGNANLALLTFVSVLIIACPCALGLATPMSITVGVGQAVMSGVLIKEAEALETLPKINTLVIDKTGTLTTGKPSVVNVHGANLSSERALTYAAAIAVLSEHPLAAAIVAAAEQHRASIPAATDFESVAGRGVLGRVDGRPVAVGNLPFMETLAVDNLSAVPALTQTTTTNTLVYLALDGQLVAAIELSDEVKPSSPTTIKQLLERGVQVVMATGDREATAQAVAEQCGISQINAELSPAEKMALVKQFQHAGGIVAMAGDGINDAPALAQADVGIAMGSGADVAMESAGITIPSADLEAIVRAHTIAKATMANVKQNLFFAFCYNAIGVPIAAGVLYPIFGILLSPMIAAAAMSLSSVSVIGNALRLRRFQP